MFSLLQAWLILYLIAKSSAFVLVMKTAWWTVLTKGWLYMWIYKTEVAMSFLTLVSDTTIAVCGDKKDWIVMSSSCWEHDNSFFALLAKLKEIQLGKMSIILEPGLNSGLRWKRMGKLHMIMWLWSYTFSSSKKKKTKEKQKKRNINCRHFLWLFFFSFSKLRRCQYKDCSLKQTQ